MGARKEYLKLTEHMASNKWDARELIEWINTPVRKPAIHAFTEGPARQVAYAVERLIEQYVTADMPTPQPLPPTEICPRCGYQQYVKEKP